MWLDDLPLDGQDPTYTNQINSMVKYFDKLAIVQPQKGVENDPNFPSKMQVGLTPTPEQEARLLNEAMKELEGILKSKKALDKNVQVVLKSAVTQLSDKDLFTEQDVLTNAKDQSMTLVETELTDDFKSSPSVQKLLNLLSSKTNQLVRAKHPGNNRINLANTDKGNRFRRYNP